MMTENISIKGEFIRLDDLLKISGAVVTGGHAKMVIQNGEVKLNGAECSMRGKKVYKGDSVEFEGVIYRVE